MSFLCSQKDSDEKQISFDFKNKLIHSKEPISTVSNSNKHQFYTDKTIKVRSPISLSSPRNKNKRISSSSFQKDKAESSIIEKTQRKIKNIHFSSQVKEKQGLFTSRKINKKQQCIETEDRKHKKCQFEDHQQNTTQNKVQIMRTNKATTKHYQKFINYEDYSIRNQKSNFDQNYGRNFNNNARKQIEIKRINQNILRNNQLQTSEEGNINSQPKYPNHSQQLYHNQTNCYSTQEKNIAPIYFTHLQKISTSKLKFPDKNAQFSRSNASSNFNLQEDGLLKTDEVEKLNLELKLLESEYKNVRSEQQSLRKEKQFVKKKCQEQLREILKNKDFLFKSLLLREIELDEIKLMMAQRLKVKEQRQMVISDNIY